MSKQSYCFFQLGAFTGTLLCLGAGIPVYASTAMSIVLTAYYLVYGEETNNDD